MADIEPSLHAALPLPEQTALVLQGGGALGSYQAGVFEALAEAGIMPDWIAGISIGAINAAIIAGNPPGDRTTQLRHFWEEVTAALPSFPVWPSDYMREALHQWSAGFVAAFGVPGFFQPRPIPPFIALPGSQAALSFYDSTPLRETLDAYIDWERINSGAVRLSVGAVNVETGNFRYFDSALEPLDARHIMASGALPPGLPPVEIDGCLWWDGGLVSNTPLQHIVAERDTDMLVFQVDLFSASDIRPATIDDVLAREKEIRYSSRTRQITDQFLERSETASAIRAALNALPESLCDDPAIVALKALAEEPALNIVHLIHKANAWEGGSRDYEFSRRTMEDHWDAGREAVAETIRHGDVIARNIADGKSAAFDLNPV
ncbi:MAG: patatin-like phospholipase family protein [Pseudomonadota bacterium]